MLALVIIAFMSGSAVTHGVDTGAIKFDNQPPFVTIDSTKAKIEYTYPQ